MLVLLPLLVTGRPALADDELGAGAGTGSEEVLVTNPADPPPPIPPHPIGDPFCLEVTASEYEVVAAGTVTANDGAVVYKGADIVITFTTDHTDNDHYYIAPEGTYGAQNADGTCDQSTFGPDGSIPVRVTVNAAGAAESGVGTGAG